MDINHLNYHHIEESCGHHEKDRQNYLKYNIIDTKHVTEAVPGESHSRPLPATPVLVFFHLLRKGEEQIMLRQEFVLSSN